MKKLVAVCLLAMVALCAAAPAHATPAEPTIYVIQQGDTLWGLSERFFNDPNYWPNLWARNQQVTNPHLLFPGQRVRVYPDRIEIEPAPPRPAVSESVPPPAPAAAAATKEKTYSVSGSEGFLLDRDFKPAGVIISSNQNHQIVGEDDIVYTDLGKVHGAKVGDRFLVFRKLNAVSHPVTNVILGYRVIPLGSIQLSEVEGKASKALITESFQEIGPGAFLLPYRDRRKEVPLKAAGTDLVGYIVETQTGYRAIAAGDLAFLDLGTANGLEPGNYLYVVRDIQPDQQYVSAPIDKLPVDVVGALVVVETAANTSTALVVKSIDTIYRGDRVELKKNR
jgi:hypothetical protein